MKQIRKITLSKLPEQKRLRVAAYARVSHTGLLQSLSNQVSYYNDLIGHHPEWEFKGVYVDEATSGRNTSKRKEYQRLISDCRKGEIDIILTKSISRFGRNTVELLKTIRELKQLNISVRFEKENIDTLTTDGELLLTLLATLAEEESKAISENIRWKVKKQFEQGLPYIKQDMYGYRFKETRYEIEPKEAEVVRQIYTWYLNGLTPTFIARELNEKGDRTRKGNLFTRSIVHRILGQVAYTGTLILQKTYHIGHKGRSVENKGERTKYIVENAHEAIISQEMFEEVQQEKTRRSLHNKKKEKHHD
ncbi:DNA invertase Pin-like site-specific DNA recombinase [Streptococcus gallinaceus]|uniref:recombinase family protein n=1 Tax=Streptococcus gallinaceus TaxID=165758 RepID=UPI00209F59B9|nr:recombinase family protein [Streptococcus gallinaceus]MCP1638623.1 DNA invertase Pin-like site-specific DNA recombinase [Streptococcus gallinaceus]MCP1769290.1 DNA invertase Pin-like site-specific DNA recombinase [Streptococcus gallinaceus]